MLIISLDVPDREVCEDDPAGLASMLLGYRHLFSCSVSQLLFLFNCGLQAALLSGVDPPDITEYFMLFLFDGNSGELLKFV